MESLNINWVALITALVALYGAALSTYTVISNRRDKRRQVKVQLANGFLATGPDLSTTMLLINVSNPGHRTLTVSPPGIELPDGQTIAFPNPQSDVQFPHELREGTGFTVWTPLPTLAKQLKEEGFSGRVKLVGFCRDAVGTTYKGKGWKLDVDQWSGKDS